MADWEEDSVDREWVDESDMTDDEAIPDEVSCPICGEWVYEDAEKCPHCGNWIVPSLGGARSRPWWWIVIVIVMVLLILRFVL